MHPMSSPSSSPTAADFPSAQQMQQHHQHHPLSRQHSFQHLSSFSRGEGSTATSSTGTMPPSPGSAGHMDLFDDGNGASPEGRSSTGSLKRPRLDPSATSSASGSSSATSSTNASGESLHSGSYTSISTMSSPGTGTGPGLGSGMGLGGMVGVGVSKKGASRARSDSAPLGYGTHHHSSMNGNTNNLGTWSGVNGNGLGAHMASGLGRPRSGSGLSIGMGPRIPNIGNIMRNAAGNSANGTPLLSIPSIPQ